MCGDARVGSEPARILRSLANTKLENEDLNRDGTDGADPYSIVRDLRREQLPAGDTLPGRL